jgi:hypothetical protein
MLIGWLMNIRHHDRHVGQPAYVRRLMCRPDEYKRVYLPRPFFLLLLSLSHLFHVLYSNARHRRHQLLLALPPHPALCRRRPTPASLAGATLATPNPRPAPDRLGRALPTPPWPAPPRPRPTPVRPSRARPTLPWPAPPRSALLHPAPLLSLALCAR